MEWCQTILGERGKNDPGYVQEVYRERLKKKQLILDRRRADWKERLRVKKNEKKEAEGKGVNGRPSLPKVPRLKCSKKDLTFNYKDVIGLNDYWSSYINEVCQDLSMTNLVAQVGPRLAKADLHGSIVQVIKSVNPSLVGIQGMVLLETEKTFKICSKDNRTRTIVKQGTIFGLECTFTRKGGPQTYTFELHGNQLIGRAPDRAAKKYKFRPTIDL